MQLKDTGIATQGTVTKQRSVEISEGPDSYYITYKFTYRGKQFTREQKVSRFETYQTMKTGNPVEILYLSDNPRVSRIKNEIKPAEGLHTIFIFCFVIPIQAFEIWLAFSFIQEVWLLVRAYLTQTRGA